MKKIIIPVRNPSSGQDLILWCERADNQSNWQWTRYQLHTGLPTQVPDDLQSTECNSSDILPLAYNISVLLQQKNNTLNGVNFNAYFPKETCRHNWADPLIPREAYVIALLLVAGGVLMSFSLFGCVGSSAHALMAGSALFFVFAGGMLGTKGIDYCLVPFHTSRAVLFESSTNPSEDTTRNSKLHHE